MVIREVEGGAFVKCKQKDCRAYLQFIKLEDSYSLVRSDPEHEHRVKTNRKGRIPKIKNRDVE
jgi:hypothetical protein